MSFWIVLLCGLAIVVLALASAGEEHRCNRLMKDL